TTRRVSEFLTREPIACGPATSVAAVAKIMRDAGVSSLGVTEDDGQLIGVVTTRDLAVKVLAEERDPAAPVSEVMTPG
ncbi:CBS domain-containing protein, partial [Citrobacter sp. AAK_AS5]